MEIYGIFSKHHQKVVYIGQTIHNSQYRWKGHLRRSNTKCHIILYNAIRKYGKENFEVRILDTALSIDELNDKEKFYIKKYNTLFYADSKGCYNLNTGGKNYIPTELTRKKLSLALKGKSKSLSHRMNLWRNRNRQISDKARINMSNSQIGRKHSKETRLKISLSSKGKKKTTEHIKKIADKIRGITRSVEIKKRISTALLGDKNPSFVPMDKKKEIANKCYLLKLEGKTIKEIKRILHVDAQKYLKLQKQLQEVKSI